VLVGCALWNPICTEPVFYMYLQIDLTLRVTARPQVECGNGGTPSPSSLCAGPPMGGLMLSGQVPHRREPHSVPATVPMRTLTVTAWQGVESLKRSAKFALGPPVEQKLMLWRPMGRGLQCIQRQDTSMWPAPCKVSIPGGCNGKQEGNGKHPTQPSSAWTNSATNDKSAVANRQSRAAVLLLGCCKHQTLLLMATHAQLQPICRPHCLTTAASAPPTILIVGTAAHLQRVLLSVVHANTVTAILYRRPRTCHCYCVLEASIVTAALHWRPAVSLLLCTGGKYYRCCMVLEATIVTAALHLRPVSCDCCLAGRPTLRCGEWGPSSEPSANATASDQSSGPSSPLHRPQCPNIPQLSSCRPSAPDRFGVAMLLPCRTSPAHSRSHSNPGNVINTHSNHTRGCDPPASTLGAGALHVAHVSMPARIRALPPHNQVGPALEECNTLTGMT
jgi:hypothetical protein